MVESEDQIETWFEKEKERLEKEYLEEIQAGKDLQEAKEEFNQEMQQIINEYEERYEQMWKEQERREKLHKPINEFKDKVKNIVEKYENWYQNWKENMKNRYDDLMYKYDKKKTNFELKWYRFVKEHKEKLKRMRNK